MKIIVRPLTPQRWGDLEAVFNGRGCSVARGCWCMHYRRSGAEARPPAGKTRAHWNKAQLRKLMKARIPPGLIGYRGKVPVGWVSLGPREDFARLVRSPVMRAVDDVPVWSIICFVVPAEFRGQGVAHALLQGAIEFARKRGARVVEGYPVDRADRAADDSMWFGSKSMFERAGFSVVARRKPRRPIVRLGVA